MFLIVSMFLHSCGCVFVVFHNMYIKKDAQRDSEPDAPILVPRSLFWSRFVRKTFREKKYFWGGPDSQVFMKKLDPLRLSVS